MFHAGTWVILFVKLPPASHCFLVFSAELILNQCSPPSVFVFQSTHKTFSLPTDLFYKYLQICLSSQSLTGIHLHFPFLFFLSALYFPNHFLVFILTSACFHSPFFLTPHYNNTLLFLSSVFSICLPTSSALRSCSTGDSLLSSAFIRSAKSAPALAPPIPVLLHHHHPFLPPLADHLTGTLFLHYLSSCCLEAIDSCTSDCLY